MQVGTVFVKGFREAEVTAVNEKEIWRYAGCLGMESADEALTASLDDVKADLDGKLSYKACYIKLKRDDELLKFLNYSDSLARFLGDSEEVIIFCASVGLEIDRYIAKLQRLSPVKSLLANAYGTERVEALCDSLCETLNKELSEEGFLLTKRFSPGYGDLPLEVQKEVFKILDCSRKIGVFLNESLLMSPSKSVTAIAGIKRCQAQEESNKCNECNNKNCQFRKQDSQ